MTKLERLLAVPFCALPLCLALFACKTTPRIEVRVDGVAPEALEVFEDGQRRSRPVGDERAPWTLEPRYYGKVHVEVEGPVGAFVSDREAAARLVEHHVPAPTWIFPFDLPVETVRRVLLGYSPPIANFQLEPGRSDPRASSGGVDQSPDLAHAAAIEALQRSQVAR